MVSKTFQFSFVFIIVIVHKLKLLNNISDKLWLKDSYFLFAIVGQTDDLFEW